VTFACILAVRNGGGVLLARNPPSGLFGGLWELPGGICPPGESPEDALPLVLRKRAGLMKVKTGELLGKFTATLTHRRITYHVYGAVGVPAAGRPKEYAELRWVRPENLTQFPLSKAQQRILLSLLAR
jgi:adenine-specific DNA glycosylase